MRTIRKFEERVHTEFATGEIPVVSDRLASIDVPLLVVWGAEDRIIPAKHAQRAHERARAGGERPLASQ